MQKVKANVDQIQSFNNHPYYTDRMGIRIRIKIIKEIVPLDYEYKREIIGCPVQRSYY